MSGKCEFMSGKSQGNVSEFRSILNVRTLKIHEQFSFQMLGQPNSPSQGFNSGNFYSQGKNCFDMSSHGFTTHKTRTSLTLRYMVSMQVVCSNSVRTSLICLHGF